MFRLTFYSLNTCWRRDTAERVVPFRPGPNSKTLLDGGKIRVVYYKIPGPKYHHKITRRHLSPKERSVILNSSFGPPVFSPYPGSPFVRGRRLYLIISRGSTNEEVESQFWSSRHTRPGVYLGISSVSPAFPQPPKECWCTGGSFIMVEKHDGDRTPPVSEETLISCKNLRPNWGPPRNSESSRGTWLVSDTGGLNEYTIYG